VAQTADLAKAFESPARWVMLTASRSNLERLAKQRLTAVQKRRFAWSLPPVTVEKDDRYYRLAVRWFLERDFHAWELNNWGHFDFFEDREGLNLFAGYRFNVRNLAAMAELARAGCRWNILSLEITREELQLLGQGPFSTLPIITVYSWPPLFTSRLLPRLDESKPFRTPRDETYFLQKRGGSTFIYADRPVNWLDHLPLLKSYGFRWFLLDLSEGPQNQGPTLGRLLQNFRDSRADQPFSLFNFNRRPY
jgi:putative protease